jgi:hypothetical protein
MKCKLVDRCHSQWYRAEKPNECTYDCCYRVLDIELYPAPVKTKEGTKWGYINNMGKLVISTEFDYAYDFQDNGLAVVQIGNLSGLINSSGQFIMRPIYESINEFSEGRAAVIDKDGFKVIDATGRQLTKKAYSYIGSYKQGRVIYADDVEGKYSYGYLDLLGREVISAKFQNAYEFQNGKAIVGLSENKVAQIGLNGQILNTYNYAFVGDQGEGLLPFKNVDSQLYGYIDESGKVVIKPQFTNALSFSGGVAVVNAGENYTNKYGLIDKSGNYLIKPLYNTINLLGEERAAVGKAIDEEKPFLGSKFALADTSGSILTDFKFNDIQSFKGSFASAEDNKNMFFIDRNGKIVNTLPIVSGSGSLSFTGELIKAFIDNRTSYYSKNGSLVWKQNNVIPIDSRYKVIEEKYKPNKSYVVYYPQVAGMQNNKLQQNVNLKLKELSNIVPVEPDVQLEESYDGDFSIEFFKKNLLVFELDSYTFPLGAAHGMPGRVYPKINLVDGNFYELKDLFKTDSNYDKVLSDIIGTMIKTDPQYSYVFTDTYKGISPDQLFYIDENNLYILFTPYEIAPYAAGFPIFRIPFTSIMNIINMNGEFWKAFN